jgi:hypothetical protein
VLDLAAHRLTDDKGDEVAMTPLESFSRRR